MTSLLTDGKTALFFLDIDPNEPQFCHLILNGEKVNKLALDKLHDTHFVFSITAITAGDLLNEAARFLLLNGAGVTSKSGKALSLADFNSYKSINLTPSNGAVSLPLDEVAKLNHDKRPVWLTFPRNN